MANHLVTATGGLFGRVKFVLPYNTMNQWFLYFFGETPLLPIFLLRIFSSTFRFIFSSFLKFNGQENTPLQNKPKTPLANLITPYGGAAPPSRNTAMNFKKLPLQFYMWWVPIFFRAALRIELCPNPQGSLLIQ